MKKTALFLIVFTLIGCNDNDIKSQLIGKWTDVNDNKHSIEFFEDGRFIMYSNGEFFLKNTEFDSLSFSIDNQVSNTELIINDKNDELFSREMVHLVNNELVRVSFKKGKNINHHIDEFSLYQREGFQSPSQLPIENKNNTIKKYIIPKGYRGTFLVIHDISYGEKPEYDEDGNEIFRIPNNGILKTQSSATPIKTAKGEMAFYELTAGTDELVELHLKDVKNKSLSTDEHKMNIKVDGYNQLARDVVNEVLEESFSTNILFLSVGSKKQIESNELYYRFANSFKSN